jgi:hypothetical protein
MLRRALDGDAGLSWSAAMNARLGIVVGWLAAGHAMLLALYWLLLRVPESNLLMLVASAAIVAAIVLLAGWIEGSAAILLSTGATRTSWGRKTIVEAIRSGLRAIVPFIGAVLVFVAAWWLVGRIDGWHAARRGEIDAWVMARFGWTSTRPLHGAVEWLTAFLRYAAGLSLALGFFTEASRGRLASFASRWLRASFSPLRLLKLTILLLFFFWLPWQAVYWRPRSLAPSWHEPVFVAVKLGAVYLIATVGWALVLASAVVLRPDGTTSSRDASTSA